LELITRVAETKTAIIQVSQQQQTKVGKLRQEVEKLREQKLQMQEEITKLQTQLLSYAPHSKESLLKEIAGIPNEKLTEREQEVLALVAEGLENSEIANRLSITLKKHYGQT
jgi:ATP/maltotriose-dependent transcriptional regulator MalT